MTINSLLQKSFLAANCQSDNALSGNGARAKPSYPVNSPELNRLADDVRYRENWDEAKTALVKTVVGKLHADDKLPGADAALEAVVNFNWRDEHANARPELQEICRLVASELQKHPEIYRTVLAEMPTTIPKRDPQSATSRMLSNMVRSVVEQVVAQSLGKVLPQLKTASDAHQALKRVYEGTYSPQERLRQLHAELEHFKSQLPAEWRACLQNLLPWLKSAAQQWTTLEDGLHDLQNHASTLDQAVGLMAMTEKLLADPQLQKALGADALSHASQGLGTMRQTLSQVQLWQVLPSHAGLDAYLGILADNHTLQDLKLEPLLKLAQGLAQAPGIVPYPQDGSVSGQFAWLASVLSDPALRPRLEPQVAVLLGDKTQANRLFNTFQLADQIRRFPSDLSLGGQAIWLLNTLSQAANGGNNAALLLLTRMQSALSAEPATMQLLNLLLAPKFEPSALLPVLSDIAKAAAPSVGLAAVERVADHILPAAMGKDVARELKNFYRGSSSQESWVEWGGRLIGGAWGVAKPYLISQLSAQPFAANTVHLAETISNHRSFEESVEWLVMHADAKDASVKQAYSYCLNTMLAWQTYQALNSDDVQETEDKLGKLARKLKDLQVAQSYPQLAKLIDLLPLLPALREARQAVGEQPAAKGWLEWSDQCLEALGSSNSPNLQKLQGELSEKVASWLAESLLSGFDAISLSGKGWGLPMAAAAPVPLTTSAEITEDLFHVMGATKPFAADQTGNVASLARKPMGAASSTGISGSLVAGVSLEAIGLSAISYALWQWRQETQVQPSANKQIELQEILPPTQPHRPSQQGNRELTTALIRPAESPIIPPTTTASRAGKSLLIDQKVPLLLGMAAMAVGGAFLYRWVSENKQASDIDQQKQDIANKSDMDDLLVGLIAEVDQSSDDQDLNVLIDEFKSWFDDGNRAKRNAPLSELRKKTRYNQEVDRIVNSELKQLIDSLGVKKLSNAEWVMALDNVLSLNKEKKSENQNIFKEAWQDFRKQLGGVNNNKVKNYLRVKLVGEAYREYKKIKSGELGESRGAGYEKLFKVYERLEKSRLVYNKTLGGHLHDFLEGDRETSKLAVIYFIVKEKAEGYLSEVENTLDDLYLSILKNYPGKEKIYENLFSSGENGQLSAELIIERVQSMKAEHGNLIGILSNVSNINKIPSSKNEEEIMLDNRVMAAQVFDGEKSLSLADRLKWLDRYDEIKNNNVDAGWRLIHLAAIISHIRCYKPEVGLDMAKSESPMLLLDGFFTTQKNWLENFLYINNASNEKYTSYREFKSRKDLEYNSDKYYSQFNSYEERGCAEKEAKKTFFSQLGGIELSLSELSGTPKTINTFSFTFKNADGGAQVAAPGRFSVVALPGEKAGGLLISNLFYEDIVKKITAEEMKEIEPIINGKASGNVLHRGLGAYYYRGTQLDHNKALSLLFGVDASKVSEHIRKKGMFPTGNNMYLSKEYRPSEGASYHKQGKAYPSLESVHNLKNYNVKDAVLKIMTFQNEVAVDSLRGSMYQSTGWEKLGDRFVPFYETIRKSATDRHYKVDVEQLLLDVISAIAIAYPAVRGIATTVRTSAIPSIFKSGIKGPAMARALSSELGNMGLNATKVMGVAVYDLIDPFPLNSHLNFRSVSSPVINVKKVDDNIGKQSKQTKIEVSGELGFELHYREQGSLDNMGPPLPPPPQQKNQAPLPPPPQQNLQPLPQVNKKLPLKKPLNFNVAADNIQKFEEMKVKAIKTYDEIGNIKISRDTAEAFGKRYQVAKKDGSVPANVATYENGEAYNLKVTAEGSPIPAYDLYVSKSGENIITSSSYKSDDVSSIGKPLSYSDIMFNVLKESGVDLKNIKRSIQASIENKITQSVIESIGSKVQRGQVITINPTDHRDAFFTLLGTDNCKATAFMLNQYANEFGSKTITSIEFKGTAYLVMNIG